MPQPLSKSLYLAGLQCERRLWLDRHGDPDLESEPGDADRSFLRMGEAIGRAARALFPDGVLVDVPPSDHAAAVARTRALIADAGVPAIFEAAFEHAGVRIRVDLLERLPEGAWGLREVKSSTRVKPDAHRPDLAIQKWVLEESGLEVASAELVHVDGRFVREEAPIDWLAYFARAELRDEVEAAIADRLPGRVAAMQAILERDELPEVEPGEQCRKPWECPYWDRCTAEKSVEWKLGRRRARPERKARWRAVTDSGEAWFSDALSAALAAAAPPLWVLDFEAVGPAIPLYPGTRPFEVVPFQWSLHRIEDDAVGEHFECLDEASGDPRPEVARTLVERLARDDRPILVYSSYEKRCLDALAARCPEHATALEAIAHRLFDLLPVVREHFYHPALEGSFSIKRIGPVLAPDVDYGSLEGVAEGTAAMEAFARLVTEAQSPREVRRVRRELLAYCRLDTLALAGVYLGLRRGAG